MRNSSGPAAEACDSYGVMSGYFNVVGKGIITSGREIQNGEVLQEVWYCQGQEFNAKACSSHAGCKRRSDKVLIRQDVVIGLKYASL